MTNPNPFPPDPPCSSFSFASNVTASLAAAVLLLAGVAGCDFGSTARDVRDSVDRVATDIEDHIVEPIEDVKDTVKQATGQAGKANITLTGSIATNSCYAPIKPPLGNDSRGILELKTYKSAEKETFPSFYLVAEFDGSADALAGSTLDATMFVQAETGSHPWASEHNQPVQLKIVSIDEKSVVAELVGGQIFNTITKEQVKPIGKFEAVRGDAG